MSSLVIAEVYIYKDKNTSGAKKVDSLFITFIPNSPTSFRSHVSLSCAQKYVFNETFANTIEGETEKSNESAETLKFNYDITANKLTCEDDRTSKFSEEYYNTHSEHSLAETLLVIIERNSLQDSILNNERNISATNKKP